MRASTHSKSPPFTSLQMQTMRTTSEEEKAEWGEEEEEEEEEEERKGLKG